MVTNDSPEAVEEVLWMHFFPQAHKPDHSHEMDAQDCDAPFEQYYRDHIRKLLMVRRRQRYLAKNNYHVTRLEYLLTLFPDARFVIPVRNPEQQIASLIKQHRLFCALNATDSRVSKQLQRSAHYEFGPLRCPILVDKDRQARYRPDLDDVDWYASQWADVYGFLRKRIDENPTLANACLIVRYDDICSHTETTLSRVFAHLDLDDSWAEEIIESYGLRVSAPDYYKVDFSARQQERILTITSDIADTYL